MAIRLTWLAAALGFIALGALPARAQSLDNLYAKAKGEGAFVLYVGGPTAPWEAMAKVFNQKYPGITVSISGGFSNVLDKKIDAQIAAGKLEVDTAILQTIADYVRWKAAGRTLIEFKPAGFDKINSRFKDSDGAYWATMVNAVPYMYNTEKVTAADVPNSALDFLKAAVHRARSSPPIRRTTTSRCGCSTTSCRNTAGATWTNTWRPSRTSFRAISAGRRSIGSGPEPGHVRLRSTTSRRR